MGVIVRIEMGAFKILTNRGVLKTVRLQEIGDAHVARQAAPFGSCRPPVFLQTKSATADGQPPWISSATKSASTTFSMSPLGLTKVCLVPSHSCCFICLCTGQTGVIKHIWRHALFLHSRQVQENAGIFVAQARHTALVGGSRATPGARYNALGGAAVPSSPYIHGERH